MLASLTSKQVAEWMAFATLEQVGNPVMQDPPTEEELGERAKKKRMAHRAKMEVGFRRLKEKQDGRSGITGD